MQASASDKRQPHLHIRPAARADFLPIAALDRQAWRDNRHSQFIPDGEHVWRIWVEHALVYVALLDEVLVGAILAFPTVGRPWCVHKVFVDPQARGRGVGGRLFQVLLTELDGRGEECFLTVDPANETAIRLYEKWGFTQREYVAGFYRDCEDRFVLTRPARTSPAASSAGNLNDGV